MKGEDGEDYEEGSFNSASAWKRILILAAGSLMNFLVAILLFFIIYMMVGTYTTTIGSLADVSPARDAGVEIGDTILQINGDEINEWEDVTDYIRNGTGEAVSVEVEKSDGTVETYEIQPYYDETEDAYLIGISPVIKRNIFVSFGRSVVLLGTYIKLIFSVFIGLFRGEFGLDAFTGPIGATAVIGEYLSEGLIYLFSITASISVSLGLFNLFPIPALDGSRIVFVLIEKIKGSPINRETEGKIHFIVLSY
jgi:regulator of sigma E protease